MKPKAFLPSMMEDDCVAIYKKFQNSLQQWQKNPKSEIYWIPSLEDWWTKILDLAEMDKVMIFLKWKLINTFLNNWRHSNFLQDRKNNVIICGFEE